MEETKINYDKAEITVNTFFDSIKEAVDRGERVEIRGFGNFTRRLYKARKGRNPKTGESIDIPDRYLPFFKVSRGFKDYLNG